jgi:hypothetical protein
VQRLLFGNSKLHIDKDNNIKKGRVVFVKKITKVNK